MFIVLPDDVDGLPALEAKLSENLNFMNQVDQYPMVNKLHVAIPKFTVEGDVQMKQLLIEPSITHNQDDEKSPFICFKVPTISPRWVRLKITRMPAQLLQCTNNF